ncbi:hypothetical protein IQ254_17480 [Nodosilinea sp. LEGE 07088]|uniref:hypothetical protein n=1 Tax=Nodosilinea sp. LEGE 07088 TaxID=2777968 RepID=UPI00187FBDCF|nr:hypothetical protein [Nodosilinea sp. LEGE 07088]MBE9138961.1 hypothetical protein [Nodosilinea sp. LEGE 07088]
MKYSKTLHLSLMLAIAATLTTSLASAQESASSAPGASNSAAALVKNHEKSSQQELDAFFSSEYTYWDAAVLADYWGASLEETKARMGRKLLWGPADVAILEQFLLDARLDAIATADELEFYRDSSYSYDDAVMLAEFWGDASPYDAKLRIESNLIMGNADEIATALQLAQP